jgi:hydrogenase 3 maturation protease
MDRLKSAFRSSEKTVILGIGSELRGDDAAGVMAAALIDKLAGRKAKNRLKVILGTTAPENLTGEVKAFEPDLIIFIDAAEMCRKPGEFLAFSPEETDNISFSTHTLPIRIMADYLKVYLQCEVMMIGIQPEDLTFGASVTPEVEEGVKKMAEVIAGWAAERRTPKE